MCSVRLVSLFGGTLLSAGLIASADVRAASDQDFSLAPYGSNTERSSGSSFAFGGQLETVYTPSGSGPFTTGSSGTDSVWGTALASTAVSSACLEAYTLWSGGGTSGYGYALSDVVQWFEVGEDAILTITWQSARSSGVDSNLWFALNRAGGATGIEPIAAFDSVTASGSISLVVEAGVLYQGLLGAGGVSMDLAGVASFVRFELSAIPSPGACAVLGVAGLGAVRRRRS